VFSDEEEEEDEEGGRHWEDWEIEGMTSCMTSIVELKNIAV